MEVGQNIKLDFIVKNYTKLTTKQDDINSRYLIIEIQNNRQNVTLYPDYVALFNVIRSDGKKRCYRAVIDQNKIKVFLSHWALVEEGELHCDVSIIHNNQKLTTMPFTMNVVQSCFTSQDLEDAAGEDIMTELIKMLEEYQSECERLDAIDETLLQHSESIIALETNTNKNAEDIIELERTTTNHTAAIGAIENTVSVHSTSIDANTSAIANLRHKSAVLTLMVANWTVNLTTNLYEYNIPDSSITVNHHINGILDINNQNKLVDGYIESYNGGFKVCTTTLPSDDITITVVSGLTEEVVI